MGFQLIATENEVFKAGMYTLKLQGIEAKSGKQQQPDGTMKDSTYLRWTFDILKRGYEGKVFRANSSSNFGPSAKGRKWAEALCGRSFHVNEPVDVDDLVGLIAVATITVVKRGEDQFNEIEALAAFEPDDEQAQLPPQRPQKEQSQRVQQTGPQILVGQDEFDAALAERKQTIADEKRYREAVPRQQVAGFPTDEPDIDF